MLASTGHGLASSVAAATANTTQAADIVCAVAFDQCAQFTVEMIDALLLRMCLMWFLQLWLRF